MSKDLKKVIETVERTDGWTVTVKNGVVRFYAPDGKTMIVCHSTESDHRFLKNTVARLRRAGLEGI